MTRYALLTEFYPPDHGGIQATVQGIAKALGNDLTVVAPQPGVTNDRRLIRSLFYGSTWPRWWWLVGWLRRAGRNGLQTAIFGHYSSAALAGWVASRFGGPRFVILVHGHDLLSEQRRWLVRPFIGLTLRQAQFIGVNSTFMEDVVAAHGVRRSRIIRTHPYVVVNDIPTQSDHPAGYRLVTVARLVPRKNISGLLEAVATQHVEFPDLTLDIIGDGPERQALEAMTRELKLDQAVVFHGAVDEATKWRIVSAADVFVLVPTERQRGTDVEGLGLVYLEAAAAGLPVVASATGGVRDAVLSGQTGWLVDPHDQPAMVKAIADLLHDQELCQRLGRQGRQRVMDEFTDVVRIQRLLSLLRGIPQPEQPLVSVIIPAYQAAETISDTLRSVQQQTWKNLEIIVVDDGSTDNLQAQLQPFQSAVTYLKQDNAGAPVARNNGFDRSRGEYVLFLDADTTLEPTAVEQMIMAVLTHPQAAYVYSDFHFGWKSFRLFEYSSAQLRRQNFIHTTSLLRRSAFPRFDPSLKRFQDWDLWLTIDERGQGGLWIPAYSFRVQPRDRGVGMSTWLPSFVYRLPLIGQGRGNSTVAAYRQAEHIIRRKHHL